MIGFILAAGLGTRFRPLTEHIPKALVPVCGIPLLRHAADRLHEQGIERIGVNAHYMAQELFSSVRELPYPIELFHERDAIRGTGGALYFAREFLGAGKMFCVCNVDIVSAVNIQRLTDDFMSSDAQCALVAAPAADVGTIVYNPENGEYRGAVADSDVSAPAGTTATADFIGIALYKPAFLAALNADDFSILPVWQRARAMGMAVRVMVVPRVYWKDIGTPRSLIELHFDVLDGRCELNMAAGTYVDWQRKKAYPQQMDAQRAEALGPYVWAGSADIAATADIQRAVILPGATVGEHAAIADAVVTPWGVIHCG